MRKAALVVSPKPAGSMLYIDGLEPTSNLSVTDLQGMRMDPGIWSLLHRISLQFISQFHDFFIRNEIIVLHFLVNGA